MLKQKQAVAQNPIAIENILEMRLQEGIEDVELRIAIRSLTIGDLVKLTFSAGPKTFESLIVRITRIRGYAFRGKLANQPTSPGLAKLQIGSPVAFTTAHIHSIPKKQL